MTYHAEDNHNTLQICQGKMRKSIDTFKEPSLIPVGSAIVAQYKDGGPWTDGKVIAHDDVNYNSRSYKVQLTETSCLIIISAKNIKATDIRAHEYIQEQKQRRKWQSQMTNDYKKSYGHYEKWHTITDQW